MYGKYGADRIGDGASNDYLVGVSGNDIYKFAQGFGNDTINSIARDNNKGDTIEFTKGISVKDIRLSRSGNGDNMLLSTLR